LACHAAAKLAKGPSSREDGPRSASGKVRVKTDEPSGKSLTDDEDPGGAGRSSGKDHVKTDEPRGKSLVGDEDPGGAGRS